MSTYLKNMGRYKYNLLKSKSYDEIQKLFDNEIKRVNTFIPMDSEVVKSKEGTEESSKRTEEEVESDKTKKAESSEQKAKGSIKISLGKKRAGKEHKQKSSKRQRMEDDKKTDEHEEAKEDDEAEIKKTYGEGLEGFYHLIRADGSTNRYSSMIRMLQSISREDLETLWKLVKTKYGNTRPQDDYERVFWGDLQVITAGTKVNAAGLQLLEDLLLSEGKAKIEKDPVMKRPRFDFQQKSSKKRSREDSDEDNAKKQKLEDDVEKKEKKYPLTQEMLSRMLSRRLEVDQESEMAFELLRILREYEKISRNNAITFNDAMICTMDSIRKYMLEIILHQQQTLHLLKQKTLMQTQEDHSNQTQALNSDSLKVDLVVKQNSCSEKEDSNSETASNKSATGMHLEFRTHNMSCFHAIKYKNVPKQKKDACIF
ncbi:hypothetical protein Tco_0977002 [Tanacetum coccineum]|uniref:Uncharacterized protein n=1 Tax=Tanacetum coccineum TaxID=301880 RepID=A0ABQ5EIZ0_9ASTR